MRALFTAALGVVVAVGVVPPTVAAPGTPPPTTTATPTNHVITLITGDVVSAAAWPDGRISASVTSGDRAGHVVQSIDKQVYLFPKQAAPHITSGQVDRELFNLSRLIRDGYDDRARDTVPLIVSRDATAGALAGSTTVRELPSIDAIAVRADKPRAAAFWHDLTASGAEVWLDRKARTSLDVSVPQVGAPEAWQAGYTGKGVTVAVLDTGIASDHPDLANKVLEAADFSDSASGTADKQGHGTHVASTVVGDGGKYRGVAPDGKLVIGKVLDDDGSGSYSGIIAGMEWAATRAPIVSMSLGGDEASDGTDPLSRAVNRLSASTGALFVVAAGNSGQGKERISAPAAADAALTVGAVSKQDALASFSSSGPRIGDNLIKPEITAPGVGIVAARVKGSAAGDRDPVDDDHARLSGTSMATPHVSGAAALLRQQHPEWTGPQLKAALTSTATPLADLTPFQAGTGRLDVARAAKQRVSATTGVLNLGYFEGPYGAVAPVSRPVGYRNDTGQPVTLDLALAAKSEEGKPVGADLLRVTPASLTVPAGGSVDATVTVDVNHGELGLYSGSLTATERGGDSRLVTALAFTKDRVHTVSLRSIGRAGQPTPAWVGLVDQATGANGTASLDASGTGTIKVRADGTYTLVAFVSTMDASGDWEVDQTTIAIPDLAITGSTAVVLDARTAKPVDVRVPDRTEPFQVAQGIYRKVGDIELDAIGSGGLMTDRLFATPTKPVTTGEFEYTTQSWLVAPPLRVKVAGSSTAVHPTYMGNPGRGIPKLDGRHTLPLVDVGAGLPADYLGRDVRGKIALIAHGPDVPSTNLINTAATHHAAATLIYSDKPGVFYDESVHSAPIPPLQISQAEGRTLVGLLKRGPVKLAIDAVAHTPYDYQLSLAEPGRIPDELDYPIGANRFATIDSSLHATHSNQLGAYSVFSRRPYSWGTSNPIMFTPFPNRHKRYVLADGTTEYGEFAWPRFPFYGTVIFSHTYRPGERHSEEWFKGPLAPGITRVHFPVSRKGNSVLLNMGELTDSYPDHAMNFGPDATKARVYRDGTLIATADSAHGEVNVGTADPATYRVELDVDEPMPDWRLSTSSRSAWTFRSAGTPADKWTPLPVVNNVWDLDLDGDNAARAGKQFTLRFTPGTQPGPKPVPVKEVSLSLSYDHGKTWRAVHRPIKCADGSYQAVVRHPAKSDTSGYVALRLHVADEQGGVLDQTLHDAYALK